MSALPSPAMYEERIRLLEAEIARLQAIEEAARALYERVEMDESVGICLSDRAAALNLGALLGGR